MISIDLLSIVLIIQFPSLIEVSHPGDRYRVKTISQMFDLVTIAKLEKI